MNTSIPSSTPRNRDSPLGILNDTPLFKHTLPGKAVVTDLSLTPSRIVVALDDSKIHIFSVDGTHQQIFDGHTKAVWAVASWEDDDVLVSGGRDWELRVWNMATGFVVQRASFRPGGGVGGRGAGAAGRGGCSFQLFNPPPPPGEICTRIYLIDGDPQHTEKAST